MSILGNDFEDHVDQVVYDHFIYCDIVLNFTKYGDSPTYICTQTQEGVFMKISKIIGPLELINGNRLRYIKDYEDIMREINDKFILRALGIKKIYSIDCSFIRENLIDVQLFIRLISGATARYRIIYRHAKDDKVRI